MVNQLLPFPLPIDTAAIAGATLWALALYLGFSPLADWVTVQFNRWLNFAERSLYTSEKEFERTRRARENQNAFLASLMSVVPFLVGGGLTYVLLEVSLGGKLGHQHRHDCRHWLRGLRTGTPYGAGFGVGGEAFWEEVDVTPQ